MHTQKFWFIKLWAISLQFKRNPWKSKQIPNYLGKISENLDKNCARLCLTSIRVAQRLQKITWKPLFGSHAKKRSSWSLWEKICRQKSHKNFLGTFDEIRAKTFCIPENLFAPKPMLNRTTWLKFCDGSFAIAAPLNFSVI